jgi:hypothetical protein
MPGGVWNNGPDSERVDQPHTRHKFLIVNTGAAGAGGVPVNAIDQSSIASSTPPTATVFNPRAGGFDGGPHFIMSPRTPDGYPTLGFCFGLFGAPGVPVASQATALAGGFTVTPWVLIDTISGQPGLMVSTWMAMEPTTGVLLNQLFSSFDINASAIRFQITNVNVNGSLGIIFCEL